MIKVVTALKKSILDFSSSARSTNYLIQVKRTSLLKLFVALISFVSVPLMIGYLGLIKYGVWSTLMTIMSWVTYFDLGVGNGLRNKVAECIANNDQKSARTYISCCYSWIGLASVAIFLLLTTTFLFLPWQKIFNTQLVSYDELRYASIIVISFVLINFWLGLVNQVFGALQKTWLIALAGFVSSLVSLTGIYILSKFASSSLVLMGLSYGFTITTGLMLLSFHLVKQYKHLVPEINFDFQIFKPLLKTGLAFFGIQFSMIIFYASDKMIITNIFGPSSVSSYDVVFKLFSSILITQTIVTGPLWSAYTDSFHKFDFSWIKNTIKQQICFFMVFSVVAITLGIFSRNIISIWVGKDFLIPPHLVGYTVLYTIILMWINIFAMFLNGVQKIKLSLYVSLFGTLFNIPISILLAKYTDIGVSSVIIGTIIVLLPGVILGPYQTYKIVNRKDEGIWTT